MGTFIGWVIGIVISGLIWGLIAKHVAESKGYSDGFAWGFWLGLIGLLVVGFRPNAQETVTASRPMQVAVHVDSISHTARDDEYGVRWTNTNTEDWTCLCGAKNPYSLDYCLSCRRARNHSERPKTIKCPLCGANNSKTNRVCFVCGKSLIEQPALPESPAQIESPTAIQPVASTLSAIASDDFTALLEKLAKLHEQGILTDEEFQQKKQDILAKL